MQEYQELHFYNPTCGELDFNKVTEEVFNYMAVRPEKTYEIVVGCDSSSGENISFPVAIVILRVGEGGRFFLKKVRYPESSQKRFSNLHQRILQEVLLSCDLALNFREAIQVKIKKEKTNFNYQFRYIHADIGEGGRTKDMIKEVAGLIKSNGFEPKIKPESFAASVVADRYT